MTEIHAKSVLFRVSARFELSGVDCMSNQEKSETETKRLTVSRATLAQEDSHTIEVN